MESTDVYGLVPKAHLEPLKDALAQVGLHDDQVEVHPVAPGRYRLHDEVLHQDASAARNGIIVGGLVGAAIGLVVAFVFSLEAGVLFGAVLAFAGLGGLVGAMSRLQLTEAHDNDPIRYHDVTAADETVMLEVHHEHWHYKAHRIMEHHEVVFLDDPVPVDGQASRVEREA